MFLRAMKLLMLKARESLPSLGLTKEPTGDSGRVPAEVRLRQVIAASLAALTVL